MSPWISPSTWISPLEATLPVIVRPSPIIEGIILLALSPPSRSPVFVTLSPASGFFVNINGYLPFAPCRCGGQRPPRRSLAAYSRSNEGLPAYNHRGDRH